MNMSKSPKIIMLIWIIGMLLAHRISAHPLIPLPDFTPIVKRSEPAVVNIRTMSSIPIKNKMQNNDPYELFRWFFGPDMPFGNSPFGDESSPPNNQLPKGSQQERKIVPKGVGSGFFISSSGEILTNHHVIHDATDIYVTLTDGREFKARVIGTDERTDIALIKIDSKNMVTLPIGSAKKLEKGNWVVAIGSPFGLDSSVTAGIVSAISRDTGDYLPFIQTDVAVNPGNSGGPLLNLHGEVVGINSQIISRSGGFMGISLAIPIDEAIRVAHQLRLTGHVRRGLIGVGIAEVTKEVADAIGLPKTFGALISNVSVDSPAEKSGLQAGDVVLSYNHIQITKWSDLPRLVGDTRPGLVIPLEIWRKGRKISIVVKIGELPNPNNHSEMTRLTHFDSLGLFVSELPLEIQTKLRIKGGVLVKSVSSYAEQAGILPGDIILALNDTDVIGIKHFNRLVKRLDKTKTVAMLVRRGSNTQWIAIRRK